MEPLPSALFLTTAEPQGQVHSAIQAYLDDENDSRLPAHLATQSMPPNAHSYTRGSYYGVPHPGNGTSMLLSGDDSLAALSTVSSATTLESASTSSGERRLGKARLLVESENDGILLVPPSNQLQAPLECPFNFPFCRRTYSTIDEWFKHSVSHFGNIDPPNNCSCCFCDAEFRGENGLQSWAERMGHVAYHHQLGCRLAHARPDFALNRYLWRNFLINDATYRDMMGNNGSCSPPAENYQYLSTLSLESSRPQIYTNSVSSIKSRQERVRRRRTARGYTVT